MAYVDPDYRTKKEFIAAVNAGVKHEPYDPSGMFQEKKNGHVSVEGPHYPKAHKWYADCDVKDGIVVKAE